MVSTLLDSERDKILLTARVLLMLLFVIFGWDKLIDFQATVGEMTAMGAPLPQVAAVIAVVMEFFVAIAIILGFYTRPLALLFVLYTLGTALIGHHYWTMAGGERMGNMINFYKNLSIMGGLLLLAVTGPGKYSINQK